MSTKKIIFEAHMKTVNLDSDPCIAMFANEILPLFEAKTISLDQNLQWKDLKIIFQNITSNDSLKSAAISAVKKAFNQSASTVSVENLQKLKSKTLKHISLTPAKNELRQKFEELYNAASNLNDSKWLSAICGAILTTAIGNSESPSVIKDIIQIGLSNINKSKPKQRIEPSISNLGADV